MYYKISTSTSRKTPPAIRIRGRRLRMHTAASHSTAGRKSADTDLDACEVDIDALLSRDQPLFAISESAVLVQCRICSLQSG